VLPATSTALPLMQGGKQRLRMAISVCGLRSSMERAECCPGPRSVSVSAVVAWILIIQIWSGRSRGGGVLDVSADDGKGNRADASP
jgi:hypothetical protein